MDIVKDTIRIERDFKEAAKERKKQEAKMRTAQAMASKRRRK